MSDNRGLDELIIYYGCSTTRLRPIYSFPRMKLQFLTKETLVSHLGNSSFFPRKLLFHPSGIDS